MDTADRAAIEAGLRHNFLFAALGAADLQELSGQVQLERCAGGHLVVHEGDPATTLYVVLSGGINVIKANGKFLAFLGPGGFFGEMALFSEGARRTANCQAVGDTTCMVLHKKALDQFCEARPGSGLRIYRTIIRTLAERLQATSADLAVLMGSQVQEQAQVSAMVERARARRRAKLSG